MNIAPRARNPSDIIQQGRGPVTRTQVIKDIEEKIEREIGARARNREIVITVEKKNIPEGRQLKDPGAVQRELI